jgi:uncharacterized iron-regulated membrane protein
MPKVNLNIYRMSVSGLLICLIVVSGLGLGCWYWSKRKRSLQNYPRYNRNGWLAQLGCLVITLLGLAGLALALLSLDRASENQLGIARTGLAILELLSGLVTFFFTLRSRT